MDVNLIPGIEIYSNLNYKNGDFVFTSTSGEMDRYLHLADPMEFPNLPLRNLLLSYCKGCRMVERMQNHYRIELSKVSRAKLDQALENISPVVRSLKSIKIYKYNSTLIGGLESLVGRVPEHDIDCTDYFNLFFEKIDNNLLRKRNYQQILEIYKEPIDTICSIIGKLVNKLDSIPGDVTISQKKYDKNQNFRIETDYAIMETLLLSEVLRIKITTADKNI